MNQMMKKKPEDSQWTDDQWQAIAADGKDILVAAAAGSGKTAVLVERIIQKIVDPNQPIDVDRLLVVTFTNAAAAEMRARIGQAIDNALTKDPDSDFLRKQMLLLNRASIMTFHAFCMSVIKRYYYLLDLDPAFRTVETTEAELLREEVMEELLETYYSDENNQDFYYLVDCYSNDRNDDYIQALILKLYDFSRSHPNPKQWLEDMVQMYDVSNIVSIETLPWVHDIKTVLRHQIKGLLPLIDQAENLCLEVNGPEKYRENLIEDKALVMNLFEAAHGSWDNLYTAFQQATFSNLKRVGKDTNETLKAQVKSIRDSIKDRITKIKNEYFSRTPAEQLDDLRAMSPNIRMLTELVQEFTNRYQTVKQEKALVDFSDLEHFCLTILSQSETEQNRPSSIATSYRDHFEEILVDEYQDTNLVQETILQLVSKDQDEDEGNLFMVGDVKQSIYRFRLAEPSLFLSKYKAFHQSEISQGLKIDLANNFRSRQEVINGTNFIFKQIMDESVGEIEYDEAAELKFGAAYYPESERPSELVIIDRGNSGQPDEDDESEDMLTAELEAVEIARRIKQLIGDSENERTVVYDKDLKRDRPIQYRDIVILLRAVQGWAPVMMDVFKQYGIPIHAELTSGYFEATEVAIMLSLLKVIDNPYQDIPLASVLRSPLVGLSGEDLARIRLAHQDEQYYEATKSYIQKNNDELAVKLQDFLTQLNSWRDLAHQGALADLIWKIYRETGYYDYVAGTAGGTQRQANLKALYDRARQYEETSFRGLFRFLRFIERIQDQGNDLGEAKALGEQEDVVRIMTIHKSKGLEYPVVFVAGMNKQFNRQDLNQKTLLHKSLGFATKHIDPVDRVIYPTLPFSAVKLKLEMELLAEEMRVLYVALTRAREKLVLVATTRDFDKNLENWMTTVQANGWVLQDEARARAKSYFDWVGPALFRHQGATVFHDRATFDYESPTFVLDYPAQWKLDIVPAKDLPLVTNNAEEDKTMVIDHIKYLEKVDITGPRNEKVNDQLNWQYPYVQATQSMTKQTVTEIKRQQERLNDGYDTVYIRQFRHPIGDRPKFLQDDALSANERGTAMHMMMQHIDLSRRPTEESLQDKIQELVTKEIFTELQAEVIDVIKILGFFETELGRKMLQAKRVIREMPFSLMVNASVAYADWDSQQDEQVLVQGVIDCIIEDEVGGLTLLDYKTDAIRLRFNDMEEASERMAEKYRTQINLYKLAIEQLWKRPVNSKLLYFFDGDLFVQF